jgi:hypothetical protein
MSILRIRILGWLVIAGAFVGLVVLRNRPASTEMQLIFGPIIG